MKNHLHLFASFFLCFSLFAVAQEDTQLNFDTWVDIQDQWAPFVTNWIVYPEGKTVDNRSFWDLEEGGLFFAKYVEGKNNNKALEIYNASTQAVNLADYTLVFYTNGATTYNANDSIKLSGTLKTNASFVISQQKGYFPEGMDPADEIVAASNMQTNTLTFNGDDVVVLMKGSTVVDRIGQVGNNGWTSFNAFVMRDHTLVRRSSQSFGLTTAVTGEWPLWEEWTVEGTDKFARLGDFNRTVDPGVYVPSGLSLILGTDSTLVSPFLEDGIGAVAFDYRTSSLTNQSDVILHVEASSSPEFHPETTVVIGVITISPEVKTFTHAVFPFNQSDLHYLRFREETIDSSAHVRLDEVSVAPFIPISHRQDFSLWTNLPIGANIVGNYSVGGWMLHDGYIDCSLSSPDPPAALLAPGGALTTPVFENGIDSVTYRYFPTRYYSYYSAPTNVMFLLEASFDDGVTWVLVAKVPYSSSNKIDNIFLGLPGPVIIRFVSVSDESILLDNIEMLPYKGVHLTQDFETWKVSSTYLNRSFEGWNVSECVVAIDNNSGSKVVRIRNTSSTITSPLFDVAFGTLSFDARAFSNNYTNAPLSVEVSNDGGSTWKTVLQTTVNSADAFEHFVYHGDDPTINRIRITLLAYRVIVFDNISISPLLPEIDLEPSISPLPLSSTNTFFFSTCIQTNKEVELSSIDIRWQTVLNGITNAWITNNLVYAEDMQKYSSEELGPLENGTEIRYQVAVEWLTPTSAVPQWTESDIATITVPETEIPVIFRYDPDVPYADYYANCYSNGILLPGPQLKDALCKIINQGVIVYGYGSGLNSILADLDVCPTNSAQVQCIFLQHGISIFNKEHLWAQSLGIDGADPAYSDIHVLHACDYDMNSARGHKDFDYCADLPDATALNGCYYTLPAFEPPHSAKGDVARALFYLDVRCDGFANANNNLTIVDAVGNPTTGNHIGKLSSLLEWNELDPVSPEEVRRNNLVHSVYQKNRNPFIDHPEWVRMIFDTNRTASTTFTLQADAADNGSIVPEAHTEVPRGASRVFLIAPAPGYRIASVSCDGRPATDMSWTNAKYSAVFRWADVQADGHISATFEPLFAALGTPGTWLYEYGAAPADFDAAELEDWDEDGFLNYEEYIADTNPREADDYFHVVTYAGDSSMLLGPHPASPEREYELLVYTNLLAPPLTFPLGRGSPSLRVTNDIRFPLWIGAFGVSVPE